ncbi:Trypsin, partial [Oryctes borbonicus]
MKMRSRQNWIYNLFLVICLANAVFSLYLDDICHHKRKNLAGKCKLLTDCQEAIRDLKKRVFPENCGFLEDRVIVCCTEMQEQIVTPSTPRTTEKTVSMSTQPPVTEPVTVTTTTNSPIRKMNNRAPGEISRQRCKEYEDLAYEEEVSPLLIGNFETIKNEICPWILEPTISGGTRAKQGEFPHMAFLKYKNNERCGGTLISDRFVLTAGHCIDKDSGIVPIAVRLGDVNVADPSDDAYVQEIEVKKVYVHPDFMTPVQYNDIALIELVKPATLSVFLKPACLYTNKTLDFKRALVTGWGKTEEHVVSDHLLKAVVDIFPQQNCNERYKSLPQVFPNGVNYDIEVCAGSYTSNKDTCGGDSGGPLQIYSMDVYCSHYLLGVTSFGIRCGQANSPAVYTKVYPYLQWIENIVWP